MEVARSSAIVADLQQHEKAGNAEHNRAYLWTDHVQGSCGDGRVALSLYI